MSNGWIEHSVVDALLAELDEAASQKRDAALGWRILHGDCLHVRSMDKIASLLERASSEITNLAACLSMSELTFSQLLQDGSAHMKEAEDMRSRLELALLSARGHDA